MSNAGRRREDEVARSPRVARDAPSHPRLSLQGVQADGDSRVARVAERLRDLGAMRTAKRVGERHGVSVPAILGRDRTPGVARARHELWTLVRHTLAWSYPQVAGAAVRGGPLHGVIRTPVRKRERELQGRGGGVTSFLVRQVQSARDLGR